MYRETAIVVALEHYALNTVVPLLYSCPITAQTRRWIRDVKLEFNKED